MKVTELIDQPIVEKDLDFEHLISENYASALQKAKRYIKKNETAKDLVQEALIQAFMNLDKLRDKEAFRPWLMGIVRNTCLNHLRKEKIFYLPLEEEQTEDLSENDDTEKRTALIQQLREAIKSLKEKERKVIEEFYYEGLSVQEIAQFNDLSEGNVKVRLHRARLSLEKLLRQPTGKVLLLWSGAQLRNIGRTPLCVAA